jgi:hypothetical protein
MIPSCERFILSDHIIIGKKGTRQVPNTSPFAADGMTKTVKSAVKGLMFRATAACLLSISPSWCWSQREVPDLQRVFSGVWGSLGGAACLGRRDLTMAAGPWTR